MLCNTCDEECDRMRASNVDMRLARPAEVAVAKYPKMERTGGEERGKQGMWPRRTVR